MHAQSRMTLAALAAFTLCSPFTALASDNAATSALAPLSPTVAQAIGERVALMPECPTPDTPVSLLLTHAPGAPELLGVHYRPRGRGRVGRQPESAGVSQVHVGFFDPDGDQDSRFDIGVRGGPMLDENLQIGLGVDWIRKSEKVTSITTENIGPGGVPIQVERQLGKTSVNMFPIMAFVQVSTSDDMPVIPYFGAAAGYQVLTLSGDDFVTGDSFEGTFSGWGWQLWGGLGLPLGGRTRLTGEAFVNGAELGRDATDVLTGNEVHETVSGDGMGLRVGLAWGF
jgi:hypothetical protein